MNHLCVISRNRGTYFLKRLTEEVGTIPVWNPWKDETLPEARNYLLRTTGVYGDDRDLEVLRSSEKNFINPVFTHDLLRDKIRQFRFLERRGFHLIPWAPLRERGEFLPETVLIKPIRGQGGWGIRVFSSRGEFLDWEKSTDDQSWIVQPYLTGLRELRLFFCGDEEILLEREGNLVANFTQGGKAREIPVPRELQELGEEIRELTGARYGAVDLFETPDGGHLILEVNPVPGIEQLEAVTGRNVIRLILGMLSA